MKGMNRTQQNTTEWNKNEKKNESETETESDLLINQITAEN